MRILLVANGYPPDARGGVETYTQTIAHALKARGHAVEVFCRVSAPRELEYSLRREQVQGITVWRVVNDLTGGVDFEARYENPRFDSLFRSHVEQFQPELVHFQHALGLSATLLTVAKTLGVPVVVTLHDFWYICPRAILFTAERRLCAGPHSDVDCVRCVGGVDLGWARALQRLPLYKWLLSKLPLGLYEFLRSRLDRPASTASVPQQLLAEHRRQMQRRTNYMLGQLRLAQARLAPSDFVKALYAAHGLEPELIDVLPLGVDLPVIEPRPRPAASGPVMGYIGSLQYHKGVDVLIDGFRLAWPTSGELRIYGRADPLTQYAPALRAGAAGDARIRFMGPFTREALPQILSEIDLLFIPSRCYETYSLVAREALLAGVPVIASDLGALSQLLQDGVNGYLVRPGDTRALAAAMLDAVGRLPELKANARISTPAPTMAEHVQRLVEQYSSVCATCPARSA